MVSRKTRASYGNLDQLFCEDLQQLQVLAQQQMMALGFPSSAWKVLIQAMDFDVGVHQVSFKTTARLQKVFSLGPKLPDVKQERLRGLLGRYWAEAAALLHVARDCADRRKCFALGFSYQEKIAFLNQQTIAERAIRKAYAKNFSKGGRAKKGTFGPIKELIHRLFLQDSTINFQKFIQLLKKQDDLVDDLIHRADGPLGICDYKVDGDKKVISYGLLSKSGDRIGQKISFARIRNLFSEVKCGTTS